MHLDTHLNLTGQSNRQFAVRIGVTAEAVRLYRSGQRVPRSDVMERIVRETAGKVTPNDFYGGRSRPFGAAA